jgi:branched-chain amino acid transport system ATP-binding protein
MSVRVESVTVRFGGVVAVNKVSLELDPGRIVSVVGPNGSGKSTLFNSISGLVSLAEGSVTIDGHEARDLTPSRRWRTWSTPCSAASTRGPRPGC